MSDVWQQLIAGIAAAVVPVLVKFLNDYLDKLKKTPTAPEQPVAEV